MVAITKRLIDTTPPGRRDGFLWDDEVRGFGLKITPGGRRIFVLQYRMAGRGTPHRYTIGEYGSLTPMQARVIAADLRHQIAKGVDPRLVKIEKAKEAERQADPTNTIGGLIEAYGERHLSKLKSGSGVRKLLDREVEPAWGGTATTLITRRDVIELSMTSRIVAAHMPGTMQRPPLDKCSTGLRPETQICRTLLSN